MSRRSKSTEVYGFQPEMWPVAQASALSNTTLAVVLGPPVGQYGYAIVRFDETEVHVNVFPDRKSRDRALAALYTAGHKWGFPPSWDSVLVFEPDQPIRLRGSVEQEDDK